VLGCPMSKDELLLVISNLLHGTSYVAPTYPVCVQCKRRETICRFDEGDYCMGQVAIAGCGAPCPAHGIPCEACRGFVDDANLPALEKVLMERSGFSRKRAVGKSRMFTANLRS
jgi:sulfhydrogenase subunit delta